MTLRFETPGVQRVTVLTTDQSVTYQGKLTLRVRLKPHKAARPATRTPASRAIDTQRTTRACRRGSGRHDLRLSVHRKYGHRCNTGQTITWTNDGPSSHTATARNGSFDTGILKKGASGAHLAARHVHVFLPHPSVHARDRDR